MAASTCYVPRGEAPEWTSGAKVAHFERWKWRIIADKATAVAAMVQGEVDWMESLPADLEPVALRGRRVKIENADPLGSSVVARFNHLVPPFDNAALRRFVAQAVRQTDYLATVTGGKPDAWRECQAMFPCTIPGVEEIGRGQFRPAGRQGRRDARGAARHATMARRSSSQPGGQCDAGPARRDQRPGAARRPG